MIEKERKRDYIGDIRRHKTFLNLHIHKHINAYSDSCKVTAVSTFSKTWSLTSWSFNH